MPYFVKTVDEFSKVEMLSYLKRHENYTLFLLGNFEYYGMRLSDALYSGNFKVIYAFDKIVAVFCLTRNGSLLIDSTICEPVFDVVLTSCREESMPIKALLGNWEFCHHFWEFLKNKKIIQAEGMISKEVLYSADLSTETHVSQPGVRLLTESDYDQWKPLRLDYIRETGFPNDLSDDQLNKEFLDRTNKKIAWGFFLQDRLVSVADLNAKAFDLGQVGGVYTAPSFRQKGYSKSVMRQLFLDAKKLHAIRKIIIFTGEKNLAAQNVYKSLGVDQVGYYALFFGK